MRNLVIDAPSPTAASAIASGARLDRAAEAYSSYVRAHARPGPILTAIAVWAAVLLCYFVLVAPAKADPVRTEIHALTPAVCHELVQDAGRMIAWARWEQGFSLEKTRSAPFPPNTPSWKLALVQDWITDAYQWQATDEQILQWAAELGNVEDLPRATQLNRHELIAIWLRRIARQCTARSA